jgi:coenzyme F420-dependent glucose-6-phosphate dehydrogenase
LTPTLRYHPSIVAQAFSTLELLYPGRVFLGVGSGEAMNETPATGAPFPGRKERRLRLAEAVELMRLLWREERVDFAGDYYRVSRATIYDRPERGVPIYLAASGPLAAKLAGRVADGFICTSGKDPELYRQLLDAVEEGARAAGRDPTAIHRMIEIKVSYDRDRQHAADACRWWAALALSAEQKEGIEDPLEMERVADEAAHRAHTRFIVSDDPREVVDRIGAYLDLGFDELVVHAPGADQLRFIGQFAEDVMPALRGQSQTVRLRNVDEILAWIGAETSTQVDGHLESENGSSVSTALAQAERVGLLERQGEWLHVTESGHRLLDDLEQALAADRDPAELARRIAAAAETATSQPQSDETIDALRARRLAEVLLWIGGRLTTLDQCPRIVRDLALAEEVHLLTRDAGAVRLTEVGRNFASRDA